jgi:biopolymer transport protein ExbB
MAMSWLSNWLDTLLQFMAQGGHILWWLAGVVVVCWLFQC